MNPVVILNPAARGGKAKSQWPHISQAIFESIGPFEFFETNHPGHAQTLSREAMARGVEWIIVIGGDGTFSEAVNGLYQGHKKSKGKACFTPLMLGTGGDFQRSLDLPPHLFDRIKRLKDAPIRNLDLGRIEFTNFEGQAQTRCFVNVTSFGMGGEVAKVVNQAKFARLFGGKALFYWATFKALLGYPNYLVKIKAKERELEFRANSVAVANGRFFGGGMCIAPDADLEDGKLVVTCIGDVGSIDLIRSTNILYDGGIYSHPKIEHFSTAKLEAQAMEGNIHLEIDGESLGGLPASFWVERGALHIKA